MKWFFALLLLSSTLGCGVRQGSHRRQPSEPLRSSAIKILPDLKNQVNAETLDESIPWYVNNAVTDIEIAGDFQTESILVETVKGDYSYTLYRFAYAVTKVSHGAFHDKQLTFYLERPFPTAASGIKFKELWPFMKNNPLRFKLKNGASRYLITSIEQ